MHPDELSAVDVFHAVPVAELRALAPQLRPLHAATGEVLVRQGEPATSFLLLTDGAVEVRRDGRALATVGPSALVGELALLRSTPRTATVVATAPVRGLVGDAGALRALLDLPGVGERLARSARQRLAALVAPVRVRLRDGTPLLLRPVLPGDRERAAESVAALSPTTLYQRFHSGSLSAATIDYLVQVDYVDHFAWMALDRPDGPGLAHGRSVRDPEDPSQAEIAFSMSDALQRRGLGTLLVGALAVAARENGISTFSARTLVGNAGAEALLARAGGPSTAGPRWSADDPDVLVTTLPVPDPLDLLEGPELVEALRDVVRQVVRLTS